MTALTLTFDDTLLVRARELRAMIEDPTCDNGDRQVLARGPAPPPPPRARRQLLRRREVIPVVALFCILMMVAMMWMMMGGMSAFHSDPTDTRDATGDAREPDGRSSYER